jgi:LacI family transcriptional regulator
MTIKDVARRARVGVSTVSRVFNDHPDVSSQTREKVLRVAKRLQYRPHSRARQLVTDRTETICFILSNREVMSPFHSHILVGVEQYARSLSHHVIFMRFDYLPGTPASELILPKVIWERGTVDGVIIAGTNYPNFVDAVKDLGIPFALLGNNLIGETAIEDINTIWFDHEGGTRKATEYLLQLGHRDIWFLGDLSLPWYQRCHQGYASALAARGLSPRSLELERQDSLFAYGAEGAERILELRESVTAVVAGDDEIALGVLTTLNRHDVDVPGEISLIGFDDIDAIKYLHPPLTTIGVPKERVGQDLAQVLFDRLDNPGMKRVHRLLPTELVVRNSCAEPRSRSSAR